MSENEVTVILSKIAQKLDRVVEIETKIDLMREQLNTVETLASAAASQATDTVVVTSYINNRLAVVEDALGIVTADDIVLS